MAHNQLAIKMQGTPEDRTEALMAKIKWVQTTHEKTIIFYMTASHRLFPKVDLLSGVETGILTAYPSA